MQEHPIPQDVTGYKFHIVGNMTLKQFAEVGAGVLVAVILYNTNLLSFIKWPLMMLSVGLGGMMAFVPIEERPLDHWIMTFFRRLYNPTKFYWRKDSAVPFALMPKKAENTKVLAILQTFDELPVADVRSKPLKIKPSLTPRIRKLSVSQQTPVKK